MLRNGSEAGESVPSVGCLPSERGELSEALQLPCESRGEECMTALGQQAQHHQ